MCGLLGLLALTAVGLACSGLPGPSGGPRAVGQDRPEPWEKTLSQEGDTRDADKHLAAVVLGLEGNAASMVTLQRCLQEERNPQVRASCAKSLGRVAAEPAVPALQAALTDRSEGVRIAALQALGQIGGATAIDILSRWVQEERGPEALAALEALGNRPGAEADATLAGLKLPEATRFRRPTQTGDEPDRRTWYVDASAEGEGLGTVEAPFHRLSDGLAKLEAGGRLLATSGTAGKAFYESIDLKPELSGSPAQPTVLAAWPGRPPPLLDGAPPGDAGGPWKEVGIQVGASHALVRGFHVKHYDVSGIHLGGSRDSVVQDCVVTDCNRHGIFAYYAPRSSILNAEVEGCEAQGISVRSSPQTAVIGGFSRRNGIDGLLLLQESDEVLVAGFAASHNRRGLALIEGSDRVRVSGSTFEGNREGDIVIEAGCDASITDSVAVEIRRPLAPSPQK